MPEKATIPVEAEFTLLKKDMKGSRVRGAARYRCALATLGRLIFPDSGAITETWISNFSAGGVGLNLDRSLAVDTPLVLQLRTPSKTFRLAGRVVHATPQTDGSWRIGCEFLDKLTPEMLDELL